jgi:signal-transduction protein with cAMP-binding, CBS, and nucleotidyltransferase domain
MNGEKIIRASEVMSDSFILIDGLATVSEALQKMKAKGACCAVVEKRHEDDEYGILVLADIAKRVIAQNRSPDRVNVYEIMSKPVISVRPSMDVRYVARLFHRFGLHLAPVLQSSEVLGIVSFEDIVLGPLLRTPTDN